MPLYAKILIAVAVVIFLFFVSACFGFYYIFCEFLTSIIKAGEKKEKVAHPSPDPQLMAEIIANNGQFGYPSLL